MPLITFNPGNIIIDAPAGSRLLDAAKKAGVKVEAPCGGHGICGKCMVKITSGKVDFENTGILPADLAAEGYVLICRSGVGDGPAVVQVVTHFDKEQGSFSDNSDDILLVSRGLLPRDEDLKPLVGKSRIAVSAPCTGDGLSDFDRLRKAVLETIGGKDIEIPVKILRTLPDILRKAGGDITAAYFTRNENINIVEIDAGDTTGMNFGIAVDIGTTTVAVQLVDMTDGSIIASKTAYNAQIECGVDVISRINYARSHHRLDELRSKVLGTINASIKTLAADNGVEHKSILNATIAGNTVMTHLLLGIVPEYIRLEPYTPAIYRVPEYRASEIGIDINPNTFIQISPSVGSYVGGDITSGLLCTALSTDSEEMRLFIDIGTNGEIIVGNGEFLMGCACSAGPAFEGGGIEKGMRASRGAIERVEVDPVTGKASFSTIGDAPPIGICGSGMICLISELFCSGWIDAAGKLDRARECKSIEISGKSARYIIAPGDAGPNGNPVYVTESDIDNLIRAKAAIFSACRVMLRKIDMDFEHLSKIYIAGGFGRYLDIGKSAIIGLIPDLPAEHFKFLGNSSLVGAYMMLVSAKHRKKADELAGKITYIDLSSEPGYMDQYTAAMFLPHTDAELFPNRCR